MTRVHQVSFSVCGHGLTDIVRNVLLSDDPGRAMRILSTSLIGDGADDAARKILSGDMRLRSEEVDGEAVLVPEDSEDIGYKKQLAYVYAGRFKTTRGWMRPVGIVEVFSADARRWAAKQTADFQGELTGESVRKYLVDSAEDSPAQAMAEWNRACADFYVHGMQEAVLVGGRWTIWEPCGELPYWWQPHRTREDALADALAAGRHVQTFREWPSRHEAKHSGKPSVEVLTDDVARVAVFELEREGKRHAIAERVGEEVRRRAGSNTFDLVFRGKTYKVPRDPFECWALGRSRLSHKAPAWSPVAKSGLKLQMDDEYHSDWLLGAGFELEDAYDKELTQIAWTLRGELQEKLGGYECTVVNAPIGETYYHGEVGVDVVVIPNLSPRYAELVMDAKVHAVVAEEGGALAHIALVGRERGLIVLRAPGAMASLPHGTKVAIDLERGSVSAVNR